MRPEADSGGSIAGGNQPAFLRIKFEQEVESWARGHLLDHGIYLSDLTHNLTMPGASFHMDDRSHCLSKALRDLEISKQCCIRMRANNLQEARPDVLGTCRVNRESGIAVSCGRRANQLPCFSAASLTDHHTMRSRAKRCTDQVIRCNGRRAAFCFRTRDCVNDVLCICQLITIPAIQNDFV